MKGGSRHLGKITGQHSRPQFHLSLLGSLVSYGREGTWRRKWERLKITGGQGSHNKPIGCGASRAYAPGPDDKEEEDTVDTVVCAPDDGWRYHPKHVKQFPDINKLCKVASCWIYIGIYLQNY